MDRSSKQEINMETVALNDTLDQMTLTDIFRSFHPKAAEYTFFLNAHRTFSRIDYNRVTNQASTSIKRMRSYHAYFLTTVL